MRPPGPAGSSPARSAAPPPGAEAPAKPWEHAKGPARGSGSDPLAARFVASLAHDVRLYEADIEGSLAHARMLREAGLIDADDLARIEEGLAEIRREIGAAGREPGGIGSWPGWRQELEDVHMCLEAALIEKAGDAGRKLHTGRSRNDQVALDLKLWLRGACAEVGSRIGEVLGALESLARRQ
ncbi:MAG TPA: lyase family protein, partial [Phycisphaerales bacterium]|nr:lyase family protein [Phycisphaerales bacterium]